VYPVITVMELIIGHSTLHDLFGSIDKQHIIIKNEERVYLFRYTRFFFFGICFLNELHVQLMMN